MNASDIRRLVQHHMERFNEHDWAVIEQEAADDFIDHEEAPGFSNDAVGTRQRLEHLGAAFPDVHFEVLDIIADNRAAAVRLRITGTHEGDFMGIEATGRRIEWELVDIVRIDDHGKVTEHWGFGDTLALFRQLDAIPTGAV